MAEKIFEIRSDDARYHSFLREIDRGIDDMESGRELQIDEAFQKIRELRNKSRDAR